MAAVNLIVIAPPVPGMPTTKAHAAWVVIALKTSEPCEMARFYAGRYERN
jgi:hypothetical protein